MDGITRYVLALQDTLEEHFQARIRLRATHTRLFQTRANFIGHQIDQRGVHIQDSHLKRLIEWPCPETTTELADFLDMADVFQEFIPNYTSLVDGMKEAVHSLELEWDEMTDSAFLQLKDAFKRKPMKNFPDLSPGSHPLVVTLVVFGNAVGAILEQQQEGEVQFIGAKGRKLMGSEPM